VVAGRDGAVGSTWLLDMKVIPQDHVVRNCNPRRGWRRERPCWRRARDAGLVGAILWNLLTRLLGLPSSSSHHALFAGLIEATLVAAGTGAVHFSRSSPSSCSRR
jgi:hypothetical protein